MFIVCSFKRQEQTGMVSKAPLCISLLPLLFMAYLYLYVNTDISDISDKLQKKRKKNKNKFQDLFPWFSLFLLFHHFLGLLLFNFFLFSFIFTVAIISLTITRRSVAVIPAQTPRYIIRERLTNHLKMKKSLKSLTLPGRHHPLLQG